MPKNVIINGFIYVIRHIVKNSHKLVGIALVVVLTLGTALSLAVNSNSDLTGRVKLTKEEGVKLRQEIDLRKKSSADQREKKSVEPDLRLPAKTKTQRNDFIGNGVLPDSIPIIETYIGACNDPFGSPTCVVDGQYTTYDLAYDPDEIVYTMRVKNTSSTTPIYMDKVFLEYYVKGIDQTVWNSRTEWEIYDASAPNTLLTRGRVYNAANVNGYVDFDWSYPGNLLNPINQPPVILPLGTQTYIVTADIVDNVYGPNIKDYVQVRANDSLTFTPVVGGTLSDAHSVDSHFIWHTASGLYYNEGYTDLMDMWGGVANAFAQWRKRMWSAPVVPTSFCGDGIVNSGEQCDDGNTVNGDGCNNSCQYEFCGDGYFDFNGVDNVLGSPDDEACDDGNAINGDGCSMVCEVEAPTTVTFEDYYPGVGLPAPTSYMWPQVYNHIIGSMPISMITTGPVQIPQMRFYMSGEIITALNGIDHITTAECSNFTDLSNILNSKLFGYGVNHTGYGMLPGVTVVSPNVINVTSSNFNLGAPFSVGNFYGEPSCDFEAFVDIDFGPTVFPAGSHEFNILTSYSDLTWPLEFFTFSLDDFQTVGTTITDVTLGSPVLPGNIFSLSNGVPTTNPFVGDTIQFDDNRLMMQTAASGPGNAAGAFPLQYPAGADDVVLGAFSLSNQSQVEMEVSSLIVSDYINALNSSLISDLSDIKVYEWDNVSGQIVGPPLSAGAGWSASAYTLPIILSSPIVVPGVYAPSNQFFFAITADIDPGFDTAYGINPIYDVAPAIDDNELQIFPSDTNVTTPLIPTQPVMLYGGQCSPTGSTPVLPYNLNGNLHPFMGLCLFYPDFAAGPLIDVIAPSTPLAMVQFQPLPPGEPYESIIVPTGSGLGNAVKVADVIVHDLGTTAGLNLQRLQLSNDDNVMNYSARFGTFYLVDEATGSLIDTAAMMDTAIFDGTVTFDGFTWTIPSGGDGDFDIFAEVLPITQAAHSGSIVNLYLANTNPTEIELEDAMSGNNLLPSEITNYANDGDTFQQLHVTRRTKPTITYNNGAVSTTITGSVSAKEMYRFSISADPVGDLDWQHLTLDSLETAGINSSNYRLYIVGQTIPLNSVGVSATGGEVTIIPNTAQSIPAGGTVDYVLKADISVITPAVSQTVSNTLTADDDCCIVTNTAVFLTFNDFVWSDRSSPTHTLLTMDWTTGYLVEIFDVDTLIINFSGTGPAAYTRTDLLTDLFSIKGQPLMSGPSGCPDTTPAQEPVWATAIGLGVIAPYGGGFCGPNDVVNRAEGSKVLADYAVNVTGTMSLISPPFPSFPDVPTWAWFYTYVESLYNAMGTIYAPASGAFYPANLLDSVTAVTWITNLP